MALDSANPAHVRSPAAFLRWALLVLWVVACAAVAWQGGAWAAGAATAAALPCLLAMRAGAGAGTGVAAAHAPAPSAAARKGDADLPAQVVPVWQRNIEAARQHSERSAETLMTSFASVSSNLDQALGDDAGGASLQLGAAEDLLQRHQPQIDTLLRSTLNVVDMKNKMLEGVSGLAQTLSAMQQLTRQVQEIGRSTHLLALNASVEATRAGAAGGGFAVVATEVRELAAQSRQIGQKLANHVDEVQERLRALISQARRDDTDADEMGLQAEENARAVVAGLVGSLAEFMRSSSTLREVSRQVQGDLEKIFMGLQSQDRLNQMLSIVRDDMERFNRWARGESDDAAGEPHLWLERLEAHYTMEEQHSSHHNAQVVEKAAAVEFF